MPRKISKREAGIRKHFGLANDAALMPTAVTVWSYDDT
jgi:hypothetical protein